MLPKNLNEVNMELGFNGMNQSIKYSADLASEISRHQEESMRALTQASQERIEREERIVAGAEASIAQKELFEKQVEILLKQNELLSDNYNKLKEMFDAQVEANKEAKEDLKRSKHFNLAMMIIAIIAMLAAIAGPIATILVSK